MKYKKTVLITGITSSLGNRLAKHFLKKKFNVIGTYRKKINLKNFKNKNCLLYKLDLSKDSDFSNIVKILNKKKVTIDVLINNAALASGSLTEMTTQKIFLEVFNINFFGQIKLIQNLLRFIKKSKNPSIINIGSISGIIPESGFIAYGSSKCALMYATKIMANEFNKYKIRVNAIAPSVFKSKMSKRMDARIKDKLINNTFSKRQIEIDDIVELISYLSSEQSKSINGQIIRIDGGISI